MPSNENDAVRVAYSELCASYRAIDDFRAKLLGFLPLATGTGIFILVNADFLKATSSGTQAVSLQPVGLFGAVVTFGLLLYELYGIRKCARLIKAGRQLEFKLNVYPGQFTSRPKSIVSETLAACVLYSAVLTAWAYLVLVPVSAPAGASSAAASLAQASNQSRPAVDPLYLVVTFAALVVVSFAFTDVGSELLRNAFHRLPFGRRAAAEDEKCLVQNELRRRGLFWTSIEPESCEAEDGRRVYAIRLQQPPASGQIWLQVSSSSGEVEDVLRGALVTGSVQPPCS
jgi:hypothetical protein